MNWQSICLGFWTTVLYSSGLALKLKVHYVINFNSVLFNVLNTETGNFLFQMSSKINADGFLDLATSILHVLLSPYFSYTQSCMKCWKLFNFIMRLHLIYIKRTSDLLFPPPPSKTVLFFSCPKRFQAEK